MWYPSVIFIITVHCAFLAKGSHDRIEPFPWKKKFYDVSGFCSYKKWKSFWWHDDDTLYNCVAIGMKELDAMAKDESNVKYKEVETTTTTTKIYIYISKKIYYAVKEYKRDDCLVSPTVCCCCIYFSPSKWGEKRKP